MSVEPDGEDPKHGARGPSPSERGCSSSSTFVAGSPASDDRTSDDVASAGATRLPSPNVRRPVRGVGSGAAVFAALILVFLIATGGSAIAPLVNLVAGRSEVSPVTAISVSGHSIVEIRLTAPLPPVGSSATAQILVRSKSDLVLAWAPVDDSPVIDSMSARCISQGCIYTRVVRVTNCGRDEADVDIGLRIIAPEKPEYLDDVEVSANERHLDDTCAE